MNIQYKQYEISIPAEYTDKVVIELGNIMDIAIDKERLNDAMDNDGEIAMKCVYHEKAIDGSKIVVDCLNNGLFNSIVAICSLAVCDSVHDALLKWDTIARTEYKQQTRKGLPDRAFDPNSLLQSIEKRYGVSL